MSNTATTERTTRGPVATGGAERAAADGALRRSHDTFLELIEDAPFGVYLVDSRFRLVKVSEGATAVFAGVEPLLGRDLAEVLRILWEEPFASEAIARFRHTLDTGEPYQSPRTTERRANVPDSEAFDWQLKRVLLPDGEPGVVCYFYDLTPVRRAEAALREGAARDEMLLRLAGAMRSIDEPGAIARTASEALREHLGADGVVYAELTRNGRSAVVVGSSRAPGMEPATGRHELARFGSRLASVLASGRIQICDDVTLVGLPDPVLEAILGIGFRSYVVVPRSGPERRTGVLAVHSTTPRAWSAAEIGVAEEIAERTWAAIERERAEDAQRRAVERYERQNRLFEGVVSTTPDFVYLFDPAGRFQYANRRLLEVWGVTLEQAVGRTPRELGYEQWHHDMHMREIAEVIETRRPIKGEVPFTAPLTGIFGVYEYIFTPVVGPGGDVELIAGTTRDVTERKRIEDALTNALAVKDEFLGLVSHELRTPLTIILGMSRLLARGATSPTDQAEIAADIAESAEVLSELVEAMLLLARLDRHEADQLREPALLERVAQAVLARIGQRDPTRPYTLEVAGAGAVVEVQRAWLERVIENLVTNASKYAPRGTEVTVRVGLDGDQPTLRVLDRGPGIAEDELERLFEPFYRSATTRATASGAGLGLAVARRIVDLAGGRIWGRAREGGGAEFGFSLPPLAPGD
jgi:PAS domain S-box-containing protein